MNPTYLTTVTQECAAIFSSEGHLKTFRDTFLGKPVIKKIYFYKTTTPWAVKMALANRIWPVICTLPTPDVS